MSQQPAAALTPEELERKRAAAIQKMDQLQKRATTLNARRTRAQYQLETARQQYAEAVTEAVAHHETSNLDELRSKLVQLEAENTQAIEDFTKALDDFEAFIGRIEAALADPEVMAEMIASMQPANKFEQVMTTAAPAAALQQAAAVASPAFSAEDI